MNNDADGSSSDDVEPLGYRDWDAEEYERIHPGLADKNAQEMRRPNTKTEVWGTVFGIPIREAEIYDTDIVSQMSRSELIDALLELQEVHQLFASKLRQFRHHVPKEVLLRDPLVNFSIENGIKQGKSDDELAALLGETKKYIQGVRLRLSRDLKEPDLKRQRGRPRKPTSTP